MRKPPESVVKVRSTDPAHGRITAEVAEDERHGQTDHGTLNDVEQHGEEHHEAQLLPSGASQ